MTKRKKSLKSCWKRRRDPTRREVLAKTDFRHKDLPGYMNPLAHGLSKAIDPTTLDKKEFLIGKGFYRCAH